MFENCTSLVNAPTLPANILSNNCYRNMFKGCISLATIPVLPTATLFDNCYEGMFDGCTNIKISNTETSEYNKPYRIPALLT